MDVIQAPYETARSENQINFRWGRGETSYWYGNTFCYRSLQNWKRYHANDMIFKRAKEQPSASVMTS
jgi:hypothetical protein